MLTKPFDVHQLASTRQWEQISRCTNKLRGPCRSSFLQPDAETVWLLYVLVLRGSGNKRVTFR